MQCPINVKVVKPDACLIHLRLHSQVRANREMGLNAGGQTALARPKCEDLRAPRSFRPGFWGSGEIAMGQHKSHVELFNCPNCNAQYELVRATDRVLPLRWFTEGPTSSS